jgi:hypothetical protein
MKDAFQHVEEEGDMVIGPNGKPTLTPEAQQRKTARERARSEEVSL